MAPGEPSARDEERQVRVESQLAHLDHQYDQLNRVVVEQGRELQRLQAEVQRIARTLEGMERERIDGKDTRPPHSR